MFPKAKKSHKTTFFTFRSKVWIFKSYACRNSVCVYHLHAYEEYY